MNPKLLAIGLCWVVLMLSNVGANAMNLKELQQADKLRVKTWIEPAKGIISKQQVKLMIEVATDKWFSGGTQIRYFEIDDAIVLQREKFAINSTRTENDKSWTVQQWTLVIYAQREGRFTVPEITLNLSIAGKNLESIIGQVKTEPMSFTAKIPDEIKGASLGDNRVIGIKEWIATTRYEVTESFNKPIDELKSGDALTRSIHQSASDLPAMLLPGVHKQEIPGISIYRKPPEIEDKVNRGVYLAERIDRFTYIFEKSGEYQLAAQTYYWWDLASGILETIELPATTLHVKSSLLDVSSAHDKKLSNKVQDDIDVVALLLKTVVVLLVLLIVCLVMQRIWHNFDIDIKKIALFLGVPEKKLQHKFEKACRNNDMKRAICLFYQWLDLYPDASFQGSIRTRLSGLGEEKLMYDFNQIMRSIYATDNGEKIDFRQFADQFIKVLKRTDCFNEKVRWGVRLELNR